MGKAKRKRDRAEVFTASPQYSVSDPAFAEWLRMAGWSSEIVTEESALGLTAFYRAQAIISGVIAALPLKVYRGTFDGPREQVDHWLTSSPAGPYDLSAFNWVEMVLLHLLNHGEAFLKSVLTEGGEMVGLWPIHPLAISKVEWDGADKLFTIKLTNGATETWMTGDITQVLGMSTDGLRGFSPLTVFRQTIQTSQAGERAASRHFSQGALIAGLVTTEEDVDGEEAKTIKNSLNAKMSGAEHAGDIAFVNRALKFSPWTMTNKDAEFLESRAFQVEEVSRMFGVPAHLLSSTEKVTSWGTGISEQNLGLQKFTLQPWTSRIESALKAILPPDHFCEFEFKGLLAGTPKDEITLLIEQVNAGLLTKDEARELLNRPPLPEPDPEPALDQTQELVPAVAPKNGAN